MTPYVESQLEALLAHPRVLSVLLDMYEGLAQYCAKVTNTPTADRYRKFYRERVGIDYLEREHVRLLIQERLKSEINS